MAKVDLNLTNADFAAAHRRLVLTVHAKPMLALWWKLRVELAVRIVRLACWVGGLGFEPGKD